MKQFKTTEPLLWFQIIDNTKRDNHFDFSNNQRPAYKTVLSKSGSNFILDEVGFYHLDHNLKMNQGSLVASKGANKAYNDSSNEISRLLSAGHLTEFPTYPSLQKNINVPEKLFTSLEDNVVRHASSLAFSEMVDATTNLRLACQLNDIWAPIYTDYSESRTVSMSITNVETMISIFSIKVDPLTNDALLTFIDHEKKHKILKAIRQTGAILNDEPPYKVKDFNMDRIFDFQNLITNIFSDSSASRLWPHKATAFG